MFNIQLPDLFYRRRFRFWLINIVSAAVVIGIVAYLAAGIIAKDLDFGLYVESFRSDVSGGFINIFANDPIWLATLKGVGNTLTLVVLGIFLASFMGLAIGIFRLAKHPILSGMAGMYVEFFRNLPLLVIMYFFLNVVLTNLPDLEDGAGIPNFLYFSNKSIATPNLTQNHDFWWVWVLLLVVAIVASIALRIFLKRREDDTGKSTRPVLWSTVLFFGFAIITYLATVFPVGISLPTIAVFNPEAKVDVFVYASGFILPLGYMAGLISLVLYFSAFIAEIVRGAILAIPYGQTEASQAIGLSAYQRLTLVILPQALRIMIPSINNEYQNLNKDAALTHLVTYAEVVFVANQVANNRGTYIELFLGVFLVYVTLNLIISTIMNLVNRSAQVTT